MIASTDAFAGPSPDPVQVQFLALLPKIERHAQIYFRDIRCPDKKADKIADAVALAWKWYCRLVERGKDIRQFPMAFVFLVARAVKSGRRVCGQEKARDAMNEHTQRKHGFRVEPLPSSNCRSYEHLYSAIHGQRETDTFEERLQDNARTPVPDQAAFRIDFPIWLQTLTPRERQLIQAMAMSHRTKDLSKRFHLSQGRISQLRREFLESWRDHFGDTLVSGKRRHRKRMRKFRA